MKIKIKQYFYHLFKKPNSTITFEAPSDPLWSYPPLPLQMSLLPEMSIHAHSLTVVTFPSHRVHMTKKENYSVLFLNFIQMELDYTMLLRVHHVQA